MLYTALGFLEDMSHCFVLALEGPNFSWGLLPPLSQSVLWNWVYEGTFEYYRKYEVKMTRTLFKFIIYSYCERALKEGKKKSKIFRKSSLNFTFGQGSCFISDFARPNSKKALLLQIFLRFEIVIFNNNFAFFVARLFEPVMSSFCGMPWVAGWFLLKEIIKCTSVFYPVCLKSTWKS